MTFSYDDGQIFDRKLIDIFNRYHLRGTFHLNSEIFDQKGFIDKSELKTLYKGHEVSCHGAAHRYLRHLTKEQLINEIWEDRKNLEKWSGELVLGMSYAFGEYSDEIIQTLESLGNRYARTVESMHPFAIPDNFMKCPLFYIWGHSFEFEREGNWEVIEKFCETISFKNDVWYATNLEIETYINAVKKLIFNSEGTACRNESAYAVWIRNNVTVQSYFQNNETPVDNR